MTTNPAPQPRPVNARQHLGAQLRELRLNRCLNLADIASHLGLATSTLSRMETGRAPVRTSYLTLLLDLYGLTDPEQRRELADIAREGQRKGWWHDYQDIAPAPHRHYLGLETEAARIRTYAPHLLPDLIRTPGYAAAAFTATRPAFAGRYTQRHLDLLQHRQQALHDNQHEIHLIIDETALHRPIAPPHVMTEQIQHLITAAANPALTIQIASFQTARRPVPGQPFTLLSFSDPALHDIGGYNGPAGTTAVTTRSSEIRALRATFGALTRTAQPPADTADLLGKLAHG